MLLKMHTIEQLLLLRVGCFWIAQYLFGHQDSGGQSGTFHIGIPRFRADTQAVCHPGATRVAPYGLVGIFQFGLAKTQTVRGSKSRFCAVFFLFRSLSSLRILHRILEYSFETAVRVQPQRTVQAAQSRPRRPLGVSRLSLSQKTHQSFLAAQTKRYAFNRLPKLFQFASAADARIQIILQHGHGIEGIGQTCLEIIKRQIRISGLFGSPQDLDQRQVNLFQPTPLPAVGSGRLLDKISQRVGSHRRVFLQTEFAPHGLGKMPVHIDAEIPAVADALKAVIRLRALAAQNIPRHVVQFGMGKQEGVQLFDVFGVRRSVFLLGREYPPSHFQRVTQPPGILGIGSGILEGGDERRMTSPLYAEFLESCFLRRIKTGKGPGTLQLRADRLLKDGLFRLGNQGFQLWREGFPVRGEQVAFHGLRNIRQGHPHLFGSHFGNTG